MAADLRGAGIGSVVWVLVALATATGAVDLTLIDVLLLLAPLVVVPVGLVVAGHYAGFAAALLAARTFEVAAGRWATAGTLLTILSPPIVAIGFTTGAAVPQVAGAILLTLGVWIVAGLTAVIVALRTAGAAPRALLTLSALTVVVPMVLAVFWAAGQHYDVPALDVPAMARVHGTLNAFGFSLAGLLGWVARDRHAPVRRSVRP